ncbi:MAG: hypothetical protein ACPLZF_01500 [Nitrososphaeria archaeon]
MSTRPDSRQILRSEVQNSLSNIMQVESQLNWLSSTISYIDSMTTILPPRFEGLRRGGYVHRVNVEKKMEKLVENWNLIRLTTVPEIESLSGQLKGEISRLKDEGNVLLNRLGQQFSPEFVLGGEVSVFSSKVNSFVSRANGQIIQARKGLMEIRRDFEEIEKVVGDAENVLKAVASASFNLLENEHPLLCVSVKKLEPGEKRDGRVIVTDQRLLFEVEREVVLEKKLFIATKTKIERSLDLEVPLGLIASAQKGRVGLIAWEGVYIDLRPGYKFKAIVFDTKGDDTGKLIDIINYVISGESDRDKIVLETKPVEGPKALFCIKCGAPLDVPTTRGLYEVECKYCGTKNRLK